MAAYERSVFLNCPYDDAFAPLFHASILTIVALGFTPRCARESEGDADPRIDRIARGLRESRYSIHDLSRFQGEGPDNLARFNMPLELGMAVTLRHIGKDAGPQHNWVALVPPGFVHQKVISDLAGFDPPSHDGTPMSLIKAIVAWLTLQPDFAQAGPSASAIFKSYAGFEKKLKKARKAGLGHLGWPAIVSNAQTVAGKL